MTVDANTTRIKAHFGADGGELGIAFGLRTFSGGVLGDEDEGVGCSVSSRGLPIDQRPPSESTGWR